MLPGGSNICRDGPVPTDEVFTNKRITSVRKWIKDNYPDHFRLDRMPGDDPKIYEVWV